jgi:hypothetical protein
MSRTASGTVGWRGKPTHWWARVTTMDTEGGASCEGERARRTMVL